MAAIDMGGARGDGRRGGRQGTGTYGHGADAAGRAGTVEAVVSVCLMAGAGAVAGLVVFFVSRLLTDMAPTLAAITGGGVYFALAHHLIHHRRRIDGMRLLVVHFFTIWALLFAVGVAGLIAAATMGQEVGSMIGALLLGPPVLAGLLTTLPALAAGDRPPGD